MSEAGILPCLYDTHPPVISGKRKRRQPAYKTHCPPQIQVFMAMNTTGFKSVPQEPLKTKLGVMFCPVLRCCLGQVHLV